MRKNEVIRIYEGKLDAKGLKFAIVVSRFNDFITDRLVEGALDTLIRHNASEADIDIIKVPGSLLFGYGWPNAPHRTLRTPFVNEWLENETRGNESRPDEPVIGQTRIGGHPVPVLRFMGFPPSTDASGDIESMSLLAGQNVGLVREIKPARRSGLLRDDWLV